MYKEKLKNGDRRGVNDGGKNRGCDKGFKGRGIGLPQV